MAATAVRPLPTTPRGVPTTTIAPVRVVTIAPSNGGYPPAQPAVLLPQPAPVTLKPGGTPPSNKHHMQHQFMKSWQTASADQGSIWEQKQQEQLANVDTAWFIMLLKYFWPRIIKFIAANVKDAVEKLHEKIEKPVADEFYEEVDKFVKRMSGHALSMPLEISWINEIIADIWSLVVPVFNQVMQTLLVPMLNQKVPGVLGEVKVDPCTLGETPPKVKRLTTSPVARDIKRRGEGASVIMEVGWQSDLDISIKAGLLKFGLKGVELNVELHVSLVELLKKPPFVGGVGVWMDKAPSFELDFTGSLDILDMFNGLFHEAVKQGLSSVMILPNRMAIPLQQELIHHNEVDFFRIKHPWPLGLLKISKLEAKGLSRASSHNPFVEVHLGCSVHHTSTLKKVHENAKWEDELYFLVDEPMEQLFTLNIVDQCYSGRDPLAESPFQKTLELLGQRVDDAKALLKDTTFSKEITMEVLWHGMRLSEQESRLQAERDGDIDSKRARGSGRGGFFAKFGEKPLSEAEIDKMRKMNTRLSCQVTWQPLELNAFVAKSIDPSSYPPGQRAPVAAVLFAGISRCVHLPQDEKHPENTVYWCQVRCSPCIDSEGKRFDMSEQKGTKKDKDGEESNKDGAAHKETKQEHKEHLKANVKADAAAQKASDAKHQCTHFQKTKQQKRPKRKNTNQSLAEDEDKQEELVKKICLLVKHNTPFNVIADTLDISPAKVQEFIFNAALGTLAEHCDIDFNEGFWFLLDNPRKAKVHIEVFRSVGGGRPESLGELDYQIGKLLGAHQLRQDMEDVPLVGDHPGAKISARFQLKTVNMGDSYPLGPPAGAAAGDANGDTNVKKAKAPVVFVPGAPQPQRVVFMDRVGRTKEQVDGIWEDSDHE